MKNYKNIIREKLKQILIKTVSILFPLRTDEIIKLTKNHTWRDRKYVGEKDSKICSWSGFSINLAYLDSRYRGLFADLVETHPCIEDCQELFGKDFTSAIEKLDSFVAIFNLDIPIDSIDIVMSLGFIPRLMKRSSHICLIYSPEEFLNIPTEIICLRVTEMIILQRNIAIHRQPLDSLELPFQHFLYHSNYLHGLIVKEGLWLKSISEPRKSGEFGHDMEIKAISPINNDDLIIGIEIFMKSWGYHTSSIASYIETLNLNGLIVISKDISKNVLEKLQKEVKSEISVISKISDFQNNNLIFPIYHLELGNLVNEFFSLEDQLKNILDQSRTSDLANRLK